MPGKTKSRQPVRRAHQGSQPRNAQRATPISIHNGTVVQCGCNLYVVSYEANGEKALWPLSQEEYESMGKPEVTSGVCSLLKHYPVMHRNIDWADNAGNSIKSDRWGFYDEGVYRVLNNPNVYVQLFHFTSTPSHTLFAVEGEEARKLAQNSKKCRWV